MRIDSCVCSRAKPSIGLQPSTCNTACIKKKKSFFLTLATLEVFRQILFTYFNTNNISPLATTMSMGMTIFSFYIQEIHDSYYTLVVYAASLLKSELETAFQATVLHTDLFGQLTFSVTNCCKFTTIYLHGPYFGK